MKRFLIILVISTALAVTQARAGAGHEQAPNHGNLPGYPAMCNPVRPADRFCLGVELTNGILDTSHSQFYAITLTNHVTWTFEGHRAGRSFWLKVLQGSTGGWTNSWDPGVIWPRHIPPQTSTVAGDWDLFHFMDDGTYWSGTAEGIGYTTNAIASDYALEFNGNNHVSIASAVSGWSSGFTFEAWVHPSSFSNYQNVFYDGKFGFIVNGNGTCNAQMPGGNVATGSIALNTWSHLAMAYNGTSITFYVNGNSVGSVSTSAQSPSSGPMWIGASPSNGGERFFNGIIDEVRVSDYARYTSNFTPATRLSSDSHTLALWNFDEGSGTTAADNSGHGYTGTLEGNPLPTWVAGQ